MKAWELLSENRSDCVHHTAWSVYRWTRGADAKDKNGAVVDWSDPNAVCYCARGAILKCYRGDPGSPLDRLAKHLGSPGDFGPDESAVLWNDDSDYETVVSTLKELDI